jgi:hypothetical protein
LSWVQLVLAVIVNSEVSAIYFKFKISRLAYQALVVLTGLFYK